MSNVVKLPFPLTPQFKSMLQSGVGTRDLDVRWVSSLSWYFLTLFGLQPVYNFILGSNNGNVTPISHPLPSLPYPTIYPNPSHLMPTSLANSSFSPAASQVSQQMAQAQMGGMPGMGPEQDPDKLFANEAENLEVLEHRCILDGIEDRLLASLA